MLKKQPIKCSNCLLKQDVHGTHKSIYLHITLVYTHPFNQHCFKGEGIVILHCRPETRYYNLSNDCSKDFWQRLSLSFLNYQANYQLF